MFMHLVLCVWMGVVCSVDVWCVFGWYMCAWLVGVVGVGGTYTPTNNICMPKYITPTSSHPQMYSLHPTPITTHMR